MSETKREGHIRRITNALIADEAKVGIRFTHDAVVELLELLKVQPVIYCRDCKHYDGRPCGIVDWWNMDDDFCSRAERRTDEGD